MPFSCIFKLNNGAIKINDKIVFEEYIDSAFGKFEKIPVKIARVKFNEQNAFIYSNCPCYISSKGTLKKGDRVYTETKIGYFISEGEEIPYQKPYATIKFE